jgi:hypothetical protein
VTPRQHEQEHEQLALIDPLDDGLTFGEWIESLPLDPSEKRPAR